MSERQRRKLDHVRLAVEQPDRPVRRAGALPAPGWEEVHLVNQSLPELAAAEIDLRTQVAGVNLDKPIIINAMTGGASEVESINRTLAAVAAEVGVAMAVGSQTAGLRDPSVIRTYSVVRAANPRGVILANVSALTPVDAALRAVEMVEANLLQVHLNAPQELVMLEGDRDFRGQLLQIEKLAREIPVPVVVKECGFGLSRETIQALAAVGVRAADVSGRGGTNFAWIEAARRGESVDPGLKNWGIPTACSLAEAAALNLSEFDLIASGGIIYGSDAARAFALGASAVGVAGAVLRQLTKGGEQGAAAYLRGMLQDLTHVCLLTGADSVRTMREVPVVLTGETAQWCELRGVSVHELARRRWNPPVHRHEDGAR